MNREESIEKIMKEMAEMSNEMQEEFLAGLQIIAGKVPTNTAAALRLKQKLMESQEEGNPVDEKLLRHFTC